MKGNSKSSQDERKIQNLVAWCIFIAFAVLLIGLTFIINAYIKNSNQMIFMLDYEKINDNFKDDIKKCIGYREGVDEIALYDIVDTCKSSYEYGVTEIKCKKKVNKFFTIKVSITLSKDFSVLKVSSNFDGNTNKDYERMLTNKIFWISTGIAWILILILMLIIVLIFAKRLKVISKHKKAINKIQS